MKTPLKIGTRGSKLALYQAELTKAKILKDFPSFQIEIVIIKTSGDMIRRGNPTPLETKRVFTREIEDALVKGEVDMAIHSAKDLTVNLPDGTHLGAVLEREDSRDCFVSLEGKTLANLPKGSRVGTSSLRRKKQLLRFYPDLVVEDVRGNVDTRVKKVEEGKLEGIILAHAGLKRIGLLNHVSEVLDENIFYPAPGQGTIVVQTRKGDMDLTQALRVINHMASSIRLECERAFLRKLEGGCQLPCGIVTEIQTDKINARGVLFDIASDRFVEAELKGEVTGPELLGTALAQKILDTGGREILENIRKENDQ